MLLFVFVTRNLALPPINNILVLIAEIILICSTQIAYFSRCQLIHILSLRDKWETLIEVLTWLIMN